VEAASSVQPRSVLSIKNAAQVIKRKASFGAAGTLDLRVNVSKKLTDV
jgi:hypothetical protein